MTTAVDTNVLLDVLVPNEAFKKASGRALQRALRQGNVCICDIVYAELCIYFETQRECDRFLGDLGIRVQPLTREADFLASRIWRTYRRQGGRRTRILPDFQIGAHAQTQGAWLLSRYRGFYRDLFPRLDLWDPAVTDSPHP